jgi:hypothetical protein
MKLSDIVYYCNHLDSINTAAATQQAMTELNAIRHVVEHGGTQIGDYAEQIHKKI